MTVIVGATVSIVKARVARPGSRGSVWVAASVRAPSGAPVSVTVRGDVPEAARPGTATALRRSRHVIVAPGAVPVIWYVAGVCAPFQESPSAPEIAGAAVATEAGSRPMRTTAASRRGRATGT